MSIQSTGNPVKIVIRTIDQNTPPNRLINIQSALTKPDSTQDTSAIHSTISLHRVSSIKSSRYGESQSHSKARQAVVVRRTGSTRLADIQSALKDSRTPDTCSIAPVDPSPPPIAPRQAVVLRRTESTRLADIQSALKDSRTPDTCSIAPVDPSSPPIAIVSAFPTHLADPNNALETAASGQSICIHCDFHRPGESSLLLDIIRILRLKYNESPECLIVTATNKFSASKIDGVTLDDFVGSFSTDTDPTLVFLTTKQITEMDKCWMKARTLLIADVHMLDGRHFDIIDQAARFIKYNISQPFGGLQVIAAGHFSELSDPGADFVFPFRAKGWADTFNQLSTMTQVHRKNW